MVNHLCFDLFSRVREIHGTGVIAGGHLGLGSLQRRYEHGVNEGGLHASESRRHVSSHAEIGILVDSAGNQTRHVFTTLKSSTGLMGVTGLMGLEVMGMVLKELMGLVVYELMGLVGLDVMGLAGLEVMGLVGMDVMGLD